MKNHRARPGASPAEDDCEQLRHDHQVELQAQIEELRHCQVEMEKTLEKYKALYEFSPFGYLTLDRRGDITAVNFCAANLLGGDVSRLIGQRFMLYILEEFRPVFVAFLQNVFSSQRKESCEVALQAEEKSYFMHVEAQCFHGEECHLALSDISARKELEISLRYYAKRNMVTEEAMRKKFAAELHDEIAQDLTALALNLTAICNGLPREIREKLGEKIIVSTCLVEEMGHKIRDIMVRLRPPVLDSFGLAVALSWYGGLFAKQTGIVVDFHLEELNPRLSDEIETALFRISQEALTNVKKHAAAMCVTLSLKKTKGVVQLSIKDDGKGFDATQQRRCDSLSGWGLNLMRERATSVGARFFLDANPGQGTVIFVEIGEEH